MQQKISNNKEIKLYVLESVFYFVLNYGLSVIQGSKVFHLFFPLFSGIHNGQAGSRNQKGAT